MKTYLTQTQYNTYKYQRRVPKPLLEYTQSSSFRVSLGTDSTEAVNKALQYNKSIEDALQYIKLGLPYEMIVSTLDGLISKEKVQKQKDEEASKGLFLTTAHSLLNSKKDTVSIDDYTNSKYFYTELAPSIFKKIVGCNNPKMADISYDDLLKFKAVLIQMPKRNIWKYKSMDVDSVLKILDDIPKEHLVTANTVNKYLLRLRAIFNFSLVMGDINVNLAKSITILQTDDERLQRLPLDDKEYDGLITLLPKEKKYLVQILAYSGMRLSELYKCKIENIEGVPCFSLLDRSIKLKTKSSYRVIPIHSSLLHEINNFTLYRNMTTSDNLAKTVSKLIKKNNFKEAHKKSLYSLRHSFATNLIKVGANDMIVSELLGHSHKHSMTLSRYASGYSVIQLKEVIELL